MMTNVSAIRRKFGRFLKLWIYGCWKCLEVRVGADILAKELAQAYNLMWWREMNEIEWRRNSGEWAEDNQTSRTNIQSIYEYLMWWAGMEKWDQSRDWGLCATKIQGRQKRRRQKQTPCWTAAPLRRISKCNRHRCMHIPQASQLKQQINSSDAGLQLKVFIRNGDTDSKHWGNYQLVNGKIRALWLVWPGFTIRKPTISGICFRQ